MALLQRLPVKEGVLSQLSVTGCLSMKRQTAGHAAKSSLQKKENTIYYNQEKIQDCGLLRR